MYRLVVLVLLAATGCLLGTRPPPAPRRDPALSLTTRSWTLPSGLRVLKITDPRATDVQVTLRLPVGAAHDPPGREGLAHVVEHLTFELVIGAQSITDRLTRTATYFNAFTTLDATTYVARAPSTRLRELLAIEALRLTAPCDALAESELAREREVVLNELRQNAHALELHAVILENLFPQGHPARRRLGGTAASVATITRDDACAFLAEHYSVGDAVLVISGAVSDAEVEAVVTAELGQVAPRAATRPPVSFPPISIESGALSMRVTAAVGTDAFVIAWPPPRAPERYAQRAAVLALARRMLAGSVDGAVEVHQVGAGAAQLDALIVRARGDVNASQLASRVDAVLSSLPDEYEPIDIVEIDRLMMSPTRHGGLHSLYATLDDPLARDPAFARWLAAGLDPVEYVASFGRSVAALTRDDALSIARDELRYSTGQAILVTASDETPPATARAADILLHRRVTAPTGDAHRPATIPTPTAPAVRTRTLANGLDVVLIPRAGVPVIDIRMVFRSGRGDETRRGLAYLAADSLRWDERYAKDSVLFRAAGGRASVEADVDATTFAVRGLAPQADYLLAGLRRWVRDGWYNDGDLLGGLSRRSGASATWSDAWRAAMFGAAHPYSTTASHHVDTSITAAEVEAFRVAHFTPSNGALVITGDFDPELVGRWIDYLFGDWSGVAAPTRPTPRAESAPMSLASIEETAHVELTVALPVTVSDRAAQLVASQMLEEVASEVRSQLGATYGAVAAVSDLRLATHHVLQSSIDAPRITEAVTLIAARLARLRADPAYAAQIFVTARDHVIARLSTISGTSELAELAVHDVSRGREVFSGLNIATSVRDLTIDRMTGALADLDLSRATIAMRGPAELERAFAALGRQATRIEVPEISDASEPLPVRESTFRVRHEYADPLTSSSWPVRFTYQVMAGASFLTIQHPRGWKNQSDLYPSTRRVSYVGPRAALSLGYRRSAWRGGLHLGLERVSGESGGQFVITDSLTMVDLVPYVQRTLSGRFWVGVFGGARFGHDGDAVVHPMAGGELGIDLVPFAYRNWNGDVSWLGAYVRYTSVWLEDPTRYNEIGVGVMVRR